MDDQRAQLVDAVARAGGQALIALDFDGTLAPLVLDPATSRPADGVIESIEALARHGAQVAIITGRTAAAAIELSGLGNVDGLVVHGLYGAEQWRAAKVTTQPDSAQIERARKPVAKAVADTPGTDDVWIEDKRLSLVVHTRQSADPSALLETLRAPITAIAADCGLEVHDGHFVLELRLPGFDKGQVLSALMAEERPEAVLFCGDDVGDLPAFEIVASLHDDGMDAFGVLVGPGNAALVQAAHVRVATPDELAMLLHDIAAAQR